MLTKSTISRRTFLELSATSAVTALALGMPGSALSAPRKVNIFMGTTPDYANVWVGLKKGYFEKENIDASIRLFPSGSAASDAFRTGEAEFLCCGDIPGVRLWKTMGTRYIAPISRDFYSPVMVVKKEISSPAEIKGKTIATQTGSAFMMMVGLINTKYGLSEGDYKLTNMEPTDMVISLERGAIDGFIWASPFEERAKQVSGDKVHVLIRGEDVGFPNAVGLNTRSDLIESDRDMVQAFVRALAAASDWCMKNKDGTSEVIADALKLEPKIAAVTQKMDFTTNLDQGLYKYFYHLGKYLEQKGLIDAPMDWSKYFDTSFLKNVDPARVEKMAATY